MKILITGATGLVGSHIAEKFCEHGDEVFALVRSDSDTRFLETLGVEFRYGSITDPMAVYAAMEGMDCVCHAAAITEEWTSQELAQQVNVDGTENMLEAALSRGVKRFFFVSSLSVLGYRPHYNTGVESDYVKSGDPYIDTKMDAEKLVRRFERFGMATTIMRPGFMYGPRDRRFLPRILTHIKNGSFRFLGDGKNKSNVNYVGNFADSVVLAAGTPRSIGQIYNIANDDKSLDMQALIYKIADTWGYPRPEKHVPVAVAKAAVSIMEGSARLVRSKKPPYITKTRLKFLSYNLEFDISKAREELGFENRVRIDEGLALTKQWMETHEGRAEEKVSAGHVQGRSDH